MTLADKIICKQDKISVTGLGYVGMPLAVAFASKAEVIGFDTNNFKIEQYKAGHDLTREVGDEKLKQVTIRFTSDEIELRRAKFHIIAVPTPINEDTTPDLRPIKIASQTLGRNLTKGSIVVYESTVYPGVTEEICIPILEKESGLKCGVDFKVGYSPERINPGDKMHTVDKIVKVVSGIDDQTLDEVARIYELITSAGVYRAQSIRVAEAAKVIENSQRDINIAFMNELSIIFNKMDIDTKAVLDTAGTKWNFLKFNPGLVGGHCIGVDPYYLTYKAQQLGYHSQIILSGRRINDSMGKYVAENTLKALIKAGKQIKGAKVAIMGITFKENCQDVRNTKVVDIINELEEYGINVKVYDPVASPEEVWQEYKIPLNEKEEIQDMDAVIAAVSHDDFVALGLEGINTFYKHKESISAEDFVQESLQEIAASVSDRKVVGRVLIDIKGIYDKDKAIEKGYIYWRL